jgi:hypothetical protein
MNNEICTSLFIGLALSESLNVGLLYTCNMQNAYNPKPSHNFDYSPDAVRVTKSPTQKEWNVARTAKIGDAHKLLAGKLEKIELLADPGKGGKKILKWILKKQDGEVRTGLMRLSTGCNSGLHNEPLDSIKGGGNFSSSSSTIRFSTRSLLHATSYLQVTMCGKRRIYAEWPIEF